MKAVEAAADSMDELTVKENVARDCLNIKYVFLKTYPFPHITEARTDIFSGFSPPC